MTGTRSPSHGYPESLVAELAAALGSEHVPTCSVGPECGRCSAWNRRARRALRFLVDTHRLNTVRSERHTRADERRRIAEWLSSAEAGEVAGSAFAEAVAAGADTTVLIRRKLADKIRPRPPGREPP